MDNSTRARVCVDFQAVQVCIRVRARLRALSCSLNSAFSQSIVSNMTGAHWSDEVGCKGQKGGSKVP